jgi:UDP-N-acetylmuramoylalanine--D-glutamate ligase
MQGQNILILGLGASGLAMARWCVRTGAARVTVADTRSARPSSRRCSANCPRCNLSPVRLGATLVEGQSLHAVYRSPGLSPAEVAPVL